jgi:hypothetical protein
MQTASSILLLAFLLCSFASDRARAFDSQRNDCKTQRDDLTKTTVYITAEIEPLNAGGLPALIREFGKRIILDSIPDDLDTKFIIAFIVKKDGQIIGERILKDKTGGTVGRQMIKIVKSIKWTPAECDGKKVSMLVKLPLQICLMGEEG